MSNRETELGTLIIVVLKARNLNDKHSLYKQDVFAQVTLNGTTKKTKVAVRGGQHPEWDEEIRYPVLKQSGDKFSKLEVACYAKEPRSDDILGRGELDITDTLKTGEFDDWVPLNIDGVVRGDLYLEMTFYSNGPVPIPPPSAPSSYAARWSHSSPSNLEGISLKAVDSQPGAPTRPLQPSRHPSGSLATEPRHPINHLRLTQNPSGPQVYDSITTAALHNLLSDPVTSQQPQSKAYYSPNGHHSRSSSASSAQRADSPLPPRPCKATSPAGLPSTLTSGGRGTHPQQTPSHPSITPQLPSILRAGVGRIVLSPNPSQHIPDPLQRSSIRIMPHDNDISIANSQTYTPRSTPNDTLTIGNTHTTPRLKNTSFPPLFPANPAIAQHPCGATASQLWHQEANLTESFSFPMPVPHVPAPGEPNGPNSYAPPPVQTSYTYTLPPTGDPAPPSQTDCPLPPPRSSYPLASYTSSAPQPTTHYWQQPSLQDKLSSSFHQVRYSTPLPLPPGSENPSHSQRSLSSSNTTPDQARIEVLRQNEKGAEQRKTQEERDRELALALDRELNLQS